MRWWSKSLHHASSTGKIWRWTKVKKSRTTKDMLIRMKQSPPPPPPSSVWFCRRAALISPAVTLLWRITLPLCYTRMRKQEGTGRSEKRVRKSCQRLCSPQILSVPETIFWDWCRTSPQQFVPRRCHTYWGYLTLSSPTVQQQNTGGAVVSQQICCFKK